MKSDINGILVSETEKYLTYLSVFRAKLMQNINKKNLMPYVIYRFFARKGCFIFSHYHLYTFRRSKTIVYVCVT